MSRPRRVALVPGVCALLLVGALPSARAAERALPETVTVHDSRTSAAIVDIAEVQLDASWYWDSEQEVWVTVPNGFRPGHRLTVYFDLNADSTPDGHYDLRLKAPKRPGGKWLRMDEEFRLGGGWGDGGKRVRCSDSEGGSPAAGGIRVNARSVSLALDLWYCLHAPTPGGIESSSWRAAVRVAKGRNADMAPNGRRWSSPVAGWGPCDPSGGQCP